MPSVESQSRLPLFFFSYKCKKKNEIFVKNAIMWIGFAESRLDGAGAFFYNHIWYRKQMYIFSDAITE